jgi:hypothetical protein
LHLGRSVFNIENLQMHNTALFPIYSVHNNVEIHSSATLPVHLTGSYAVAREKLKLAEDTSTLETDVDEESRVRRKRSRQVNESDDEQLEDPQPSACTRKMVKKSNKTCMTLPIPPATLQHSTFVAVT